MAINMQGSWTIAVKSKNAAFPQRFIISGAATGNGTYVGAVATPPVHVTGAAWAITIQNNPGAGFIDSGDQVKFPTVSAGQYQFDIESNDAGGDQDFNDLILTCSTPQTATDFLIYGNVSTYFGRCFFNPCWRWWLVIDTVAGLLEALKNPILRVPIETLYPDRIRVSPPLPPGPTPDPPPFRPLVIPLREQTALPPKRAQSFKVFPSGPAAVDSKAKRPEQAPPSIAALRTFDISTFASARPAIEFDRVGISKIVDHIFPLCETDPLPSVALRIQEYDRTSAELAGGAYTGNGNREDLGICATDRNGNYIFRFTRTIADIAQEATVDVGPGESVVVQALPDIIIQVLDPMKPTGVCYESAPHWNVSLFQEIDLCLPRDCTRPPTACQGGRAIQAIGDIFIIDPNNKLGPTGRITAKSSLPNTPQARCAAWAGSLDLFACFLDHPEAVFYTIRFRKLGETDWNFFQEKYKHLEIAKLGIPGYTGSLVGPDPAIPALHIDGGPPVLSPAYHNIENDPAWILTHRDRKAVISSWLYAAIPGPVQFRIEGYTAAGAKVGAADDTITLFIDNGTPDFDIDSVTVLAQPIGDCTLITLPANQLKTPFTVKFKANQLHGFMNDYGLSVIKCNIGAFAITDTGPGLIEQQYFHGDDVFCNQLEGTFDDPVVDGSGFVVANIVPAAAGDWLTALEPFGIFTVQLRCSTRVTNGYNTATASYGPTQRVLGLQKS